MKKYFVLIVICLFALTSCNSENDGGITGNYLPLQIDNYWIYDVSDTANPNTTNTRDSLYVANDTILSGVNYKKCKARFLPLGFYTNNLNNNALREVGSSVELTGLTSLGLQAIFPLDVAISNFKILQANATSGTNLSSINGTMNQNFGGLPVTVNYNLRSLADGSLPNFTTPNGTTYNDVIKTKLLVTLGITTSQNIPGTNIPVTIPVFNPQDVVVSTLYFAKNIGMIYTKTEVSAVFNASIAAQLGIAESIQQQQTESLIHFNLN